MSAKQLSLILLMAISFYGCREKVIYQNDHFSWYPDKIVQESYSAQAISPFEIKSTYQSPTTSNISPTLTFKFAINGKDNEMFPGVNHTFTVSNQIENTPIITFGNLHTDTLAEHQMTESTTVTFQCDMRPVLESFNTKGYYTTPTGQKIFRQDFSGLYIAGSLAPLMWDFDNLYTREDLKLTDLDGDGIYTTTLIFNEPQEQQLPTWKQANARSQFYQYSSDMLLETALYNMAMDEMVNAIEPDSTLRTGKEWAGVWTRDVSYSIILSMAHLQPEVSKISLMKKVNRNGRIIQDTGTGGAWPVSTDRMIWATAAMEIFRVTADTAWLQTIYPIILNSINDDRGTIYDNRTGLVMGESSFIDWREQSYPRWMQPADIFQSNCLGTNALYYNALQQAAQMAILLNDTTQAKQLQEEAATLKEAINTHLWMPTQGYYAMMLYGRENSMQLPKSETLGEALTILFNIASPQQAAQITQNMPTTPYGATIFYPQIADMPPYHNNGIWPFVSSYWALANAKANNEEGVLFNMASIYRAAALFATNKENFVADNGDHLGTQINSDNMLWSLAGNIAMVHKLLFGMQFQDTALHFVPFVPKALNANRELNNVTYRDAILNIKLTGYGNEIASFSVDGVEQAPTISAHLTGQHTVEIKLANRFNNKTEGINMQPNRSTPLTPRTTICNNTLHWEIQEPALTYQVFLNGKSIGSTTESYMALPQDQHGEVQVVASNPHSASFASEPLRYNVDETLYEVENYATPHRQAVSGYMGSGFVLTDAATGQNTEITIPIQIAEEGWYNIDFRYANGNGPINTENKCAIRSLMADSLHIGAIIFPQRGINEWSNWGWSNTLPLYLNPGTTHISLSFKPQNHNMNLHTNAALIDQMRVTKQ